MKIENRQRLHQIQRKMALLLTVLQVVPVPVVENAKNKDRERQQIKGPKMDQREAIKVQPNHQKEKLIRRELMIHHPILEHILTIIQRHMLKSLVSQR